ncbi:MFS transporter [Arcanobacterium buesumense]|uniref:MFS transporter n=1 Tax=Arcanobacterium buesumense TaxID=2722751 RepID=A0A6H2EMJ0_9ACTO|nr:MFS transporter [Arcanobacterium buesumense]QJC22290.1 MFS transporter [Arcanobacterium buesumense]
MKHLRSEVHASDLSRGHRFFLLILVSIGSSIIYTPAYLKNVFYDPLMQATGANNAEIGKMLSAYAITATICYLPSGVIADKIRTRTLAWVGFGSTAVLTFIYALLPSVQMLYIVFVGMGITTILIWWGIRFKLVRLISEEKEYSRNIGISYGFYGAAGLLVGLISLVIVSWMASNMIMAIRTMLIFLGVLILLLGILSYLFIPRFEGEIASSANGGFSLSMAFVAFRNPVVWLSALTMFFVYFYYTGVNYTTPYLQDVMGASLGVVTVVSILRTYGVTLLSGPAFGFIAKAVGSPSRIIAVSSIIVAISLVAFTVLPQNAGMAVVAAIIVVLLGFVANGVFGVVSSQLSEGKVPLKVFGTATGLLSVIGFLPDTFSSAWFGSIIDEQGNDAYPIIFYILAGSALLAATFSALLLLYVKRLNASSENAQSGGK